MGSIVLALRMSYTGDHAGKIGAVDFIQKLAQFIEENKPRNIHMEVELIIDAPIRDASLLGRGLLIAGLQREYEKLKQSLKKAGT